MKQCAIIGMGRFGIFLAKALQEYGIQVTAFDIKQEIIDSISEDITNAISLDSTNKQALLDAGLNMFETVIITIGGNTIASILTTLLLKEIGIKNVIARANSYHHQIILEKVGADKVVFPEKEMGYRLAKTLAIPSLLNYMEFTDGYSIAEIEATPNMYEKTLQELNLREKHDVNVLAIKHENKVNPVPKGKNVIKKGDILVISAKDEIIEKIRKF